VPLQNNFKGKNMEYLAALGIFIVSVISIIFLYFRHLERVTIYSPTKIINTTPSDLDLPHEEVILRTSDGVCIYGWFIQASTEHRPEFMENSQRGVVLFCHGNAGNMSHRLDKYNIFHDMGLNVFAFDYRGYGKSEGMPTEEGLYKDALTAYDYLFSRDDIDKRYIFIYGASLGGAVAIELALKRRAHAIIIDSTFDSALEMAKIKLPKIPPYLLASKFDSFSKVQNIKVPKLFIHSINDEVVPFSAGKRLYDNASEPKMFLKTTGKHSGGHIHDRQKWIKAIAKFLRVEI